MWYRSLGFKLICSVGAIAVLVIGVYASVSIETQRGQLIQEVIRSTNLVSETTKRSMREHMLTYRPGRLHRAIDTIGAQEGIEKVRIFNYVGEIIYSSHRQEMGAMVDKSAEQCYACHAREQPFERLATSARSRIFKGAAGYRVLGMINPIYNAIRIGSDYFRKMVERGERPAPKVVATVSRQIVAQVDRAAGIINHLREFGRKSDLDELGTVNVNKPIRDVFTLRGQQLKLKQIEVKLDLQEDLPAIRGVSNRLEQVFINLAMNSQDAMEEKQASAYQVDERSVLRIRSFAEKGRVVVSIADTGIGMPEYVKERIFEPFFITKEVGKGTGLGLSIGYGIVKDYGGTIEVESEVGRGTTFTLTFPALPGGVERREEHLA